MERAQHFVRRKHWPLLVDNGWLRNTLFFWPALWFGSWTKPPTFPSSFGRLFHLPLNRQIHDRNHHIRNRAPDDFLPRMYSRLSGRGSLSNFKGLIAWFADQIYGHDLVIFGGQWHILGKWYNNLLAGDRSKLNNDIAQCFDLNCRSWLFYEHTRREQGFSQVTSSDLDKARCSLSSAWDRCLPPPPIWAAFRVPESHSAAKEKGQLVRCHACDASEGLVAWGLNTKADTVQQDTSTDVVSSSFFNSSARKSLKKIRGFPLTNLFSQNSSDGRAQT